MNGTSMATPFVTAAAALVSSAHPGLTAAQIEAHLCRTCRRVPGMGARRRTDEYGYGLLNVREALVTPPSPVAAWRLSRPARVEGPGARRGPARHRSRRLGSHARGRVARARRFTTTWAMSGNRSRAPRAHRCAAGASGCTFGASDGVERRQDAQSTGIRAHRDVMGGSLNPMMEQLQGRLGMGVKLSEDDEEAIMTALQKAFIAGATTALAVPDITVWELPWGDQWASNQDQDCS